jgi:hypothetical protein
LRTSWAIVGNLCSLRPFLLLIQLHGVGRLFRSEAVVDPSSGSMLVRDCDRDHAWRLRSGGPTERAGQRRSGLGARHRRCGEARSRMVAKPG